MMQGAGGGHGASITNPFAAVGGLDLVHGLLEGLRVFFERGFSTVSQVPLPYATFAGQHGGAELVEQG